MNDFRTPVFRRQASKGVDHCRDVQTSPKRDGEGIPVDPGYSKDAKTGYIPEHDLLGKRWTGGRNK